MKLITTLLSLVLFFSLTTLSEAQVAEGQATMSDGTQAALMVDLKTDKKQAEKIWKDYVKKIGKVDWDRKNREHVLFEKVISDIDREFPVTIITKFEDNKATFWFKMEDTYLNSDDNQGELRGAGLFLQQYAYEVDRYAIKEMLEDEEKDLGNLEKDLNKLEKENDKLHKEIEKAKEKIANAERDIEQNLKDQEAKAKAISEQKEKVSATKKKITDIGKN